MSWLRTPSTSCSTTCTPHSVSWMCHGRSSTGASSTVTVVRYGSRRSISASPLQVLADGGDLAGLQEPRVQRREPRPRRRRQAIHDDEPQGLVGGVDFRPRQTIYDPALSINNTAGQWIVEAGLGRMQRLQRPTTWRTVRSREGQSGGGQQQRASLHLDLGPPVVPRWSGGRGQPQGLPLQRPPASSRLPPLYRSAMGMGERPRHPPSS